jgi:hypothetical protein
MQSIQNKSLQLRHLVLEHAYTLQLLHVDIHFIHTM